VTSKRSPVRKLAARGVAFTNQTALLKAVVEKCREEFRALMHEEWSDAYARYFRGDSKHVLPELEAQAIYAGLRRYVAEAHAFVARREVARVPGGSCSFFLHHWVLRHVSAEAVRELSAQTPWPPAQFGTLREMLTADLYRVGACGRDGGFSFREIAVIHLLLKSEMELSPRLLVKLRNGGAKVAEVIDAEVNAIRAAAGRMKLPAPRGASRGPIPTPD
jgi:hypothetical protein